MEKFTHYDKSQEYLFDIGPYHTLATLIDNLEGRLQEMPIKDPNKNCLILLRQPHEKVIQDARYYVQEV